MLFTFDAFAGRKRRVEMQRCFVFSLFALAVAGCAPRHPFPVIFSNRLPEVVLTAGTNLPGVRPDGSILLPNQWSLQPAGKQIELRDFPVNVAVHSQGKFAAILHSGYSAHQISIVDLVAGK